MKQANKLFLTLMFMLSGGMVVQAQSDLEQESVSIFKNSTAFFVKKGKVKTQGKKWRMVGDTIPKALNGTFWLSSPTGDLRIARSFQEDLEAQRPVTHYVDLLMVNDGKRIRIIPAGDSLWIEGKVKVVGIDNPDPNAEKKQLTTNTIFSIVQNNGRTVLLKAEEVSKAKRIEFIDTPSFSKPRQERKPIVELEFASTASQQPLDIMYLSNGLTWKPDYKIELSEGDKAKLSLRTTIINNAEDIKVKKLNLVAGVPNFKYANRISSFLASLNFTRDINSIVASAAGVSSNGSRYDSDDVYIDPVPIVIGNPNNDVVENTANNAAGNSIEDLFYYALEDIEIKKEQKALLDIFTTEVDVEHVYEAILNANQSSYSTAYAFEQNRIPVIHTLEVENTTDYVWTSAPVLVVKKQDKEIAPISQDRLNYTAQGDKVNIKLTEAPDITVSFEEEETARKENARQKKESKKKIRYYDLVTVKSTITLQNFKNKAVNIDVKRAIVGELLKSSEKWLKAPRPQRYANYNPFTEVCWEVEVKAGETKTIEFSYEMYVSHY